MLLFHFVYGSRYNQALEILDSLPHVKYVDGIDLDKVSHVDLSDNVTKALSLLEDSGQSDERALLKLGEIYHLGLYSVPCNHTKGLLYIEQATSHNLTAGPANFFLGAAYASGLLGKEQDQTLALLHYKRAFQSGSTQSAMALGNKYLYGIGVERNLETSLFYYSFASNRIYDQVKDTIPVGGPSLDSFRVRIPDFHGGLYGEEASEATNSVVRSSEDLGFDPNVFNEFVLDHEEHTSVEEYYRMRAMYYGSYYEDRNFTRAFQHATTCASLSESNTGEDRKVVRVFSSRCYARLGRMYLRGEGVEQDFTLARGYLEKSFNMTENYLAMNDLGLMYEFGLGVESNLETAKLYFLKELENAGHRSYNFARMLLPTDPKAATNMVLAAQAKVPMAFHFYAKLREDQVPEKQSFEYETILLETIRAHKEFLEQLDCYTCPFLKTAFRSLVSGNKDSSLVCYSLGAEQGFETAQSSMAYLLYARANMLSPQPVVSLDRYNASLNYYARSAGQGNVDSQLVLGDLYFYAKDYENAAQVYQSAANRHSCQARFNMGYMHEHGLGGVAKDFYLAKRYYDLALVSRPKHFLPIKFQVLKLCIKLKLYNLLGWDHGVEMLPKEKSWSEWVQQYKEIRDRNRESIKWETNAPAESDPTQEMSVSEIVVSCCALAFFGTLMFLGIRNRLRQNANPPAQWNVQFMAFPI